MSFIEVPPECLRINLSAFILENFLGPSSQTPLVRVWINDILHSFHSQETKVLYEPLAWQDQDVWQCLHHPQKASVSCSQSSSIMFSKCLIFGAQSLLVATVCFTVAYIQRRTSVSVSYSISHSCCLCSMSSLVWSS